MPAAAPPAPIRRPLAVRDLCAGACADLLKIVSLGQPFKVLKTQMAADRGPTLADSVTATWRKRGVRGFYSGLFPWGCVECGTKGAILQVSSSEVEYRLRCAGAGPAAAGLAAGAAGGVSQAYTTMGITTFMTTMDVTRDRTPGAPATHKVAMAVVRRDGVLGLYRGVHALALRQMTNWGSRFGIARATEALLDRNLGKEGRGGAPRKIVASTVGGALACWNNPLEVVRVEQQRACHVNAGLRIGATEAAASVWAQHGVKGFFRGVVPRVCLGVWATIAQVAGADALKDCYEWRVARR